MTELHPLSRSDMKGTWLALIFLSFSACAQTPSIEKRSEVIRPGEAHWMEFKARGEKLRFVCRGAEQKIELSRSKVRAVVVESYFSTLSPFTCVVETDGTITHEFDFTVEDKQYKEEKLRVDPKKIKLSPIDEKRAVEEQEVLNKIYAASANELYIKKAFRRPMDSVVTSIYGTRRLYNKQKKGQHLGTDFRAAIGDKVPTTNRGRVVFAGDLFYTGGTVIIDHGLDIFSIYGHLSKTTVSAGDMVERGHLIGLSGNTGRSSGPHLHWGVKIQGQYVDGMALIEESKKIFNE
jgi:murein DD-endopeptidase MepM/ murein hydrolase activator NlpD